MVSAPSAPDRPVTLTREEPVPTAAGSRHRAVVALCVTVIVSYGVIYYAFPVLATQITAATGWPHAAVTAAYSGGNLTGAVAGIADGRLLHRYGPRPVMTAGSVLGAVSVAGIAAAPSYGWFLGRVAGRRAGHRRAVLPAGVRRADRLVRPPGECRH